VRQDAIIWGKTEKLRSEDKEYGLISVGGEEMGEGVQKKGKERKGTVNKSALTQKSGKEFVGKESKKGKKGRVGRWGRRSVKGEKISFSNLIRNLRNGDEEKEK
jgi:hypothetical protein